MRVEQTRYTVPGWGVGELWRRKGLLLAHDFDFEAGSGGDGSGSKDALDVSVNRYGESRRHPSAAPLEGAHGPPTGTVPTASIRVGNGFVSDPRRGTARARSSLDLDDLAGRFTAFLRGKSVAFGDVELDLSWATPFQHALAEALRAVPRGEVVSYRELAALAGRPGAQRAAGTFCAGNRFAFVLPCHRVVGASGIGGYGSAGVVVKRRLLALEGVEL